MKTLHILEHTGVGVDENGELSKYESSYEGISRIYLIKEPTHVIYKCGEEKIEFDADVDDIVVTFYRDEIKKRAVLVKSPDWAENIKAYEEAEQKRKEEWAKKHAENAECCGDCEKCA